MAKKKTEIKVGLKREMSLFVAEIAWREAQIDSLQGLVKAMRNRLRATMEKYEVDFVVDVTLETKAELVPSVQYTWFVDALKRVLPAPLFNIVCPRKPDGAALRTLLEKGTLDIIYGDLTKGECFKRKHVKTLMIHQPKDLEKNLADKGCEIGVDHA